MTRIDVTHPATAFSGHGASGIGTFPHPDARGQTAGIPVENSHFSTFSTAFSTGVFHRTGGWGDVLRVNIMISTGFDRDSIFPGPVFFTIAGYFVQKIPP